MISDFGPENITSISLVQEGELRLSQLDIRELQKAKGAIRAAIDILMDYLDLQPQDLERVVLTGSFGGQVDVPAAIGLGLIPPFAPHVVECIPNGAGLGAASFLSEEGFARSLVIAEKSEQIDLDTDPQFIHRFIDALVLSP